MRIAVFLQHPEVAAWSFAPRHRQLLEDRIPGCRTRICSTDEEFTTALEDADAAITWVFRQEWFARAPRLRWLSTPAAGREYLAVDPPPGVELVFGSFHGELIAETVLGLLLGHCRGLFAAAQLREVPWPRQAIARGMRPLRGSHVVILGFGAIGHWIGRVIKPLGVRITGIRRTHAPRPPASPPPDPRKGEQPFEPADAVLPPSALEEVLPTADHLVLALPGGAATDHLLNRERLALLPSHAAIYNVGRGNAIDEAALVEALHHERIAAAYLDVFAQEPLPADSPLRACRNALCLPHISAASPNYLDLFLEELAPKLLRAR